MRWVLDKDNLIIFRQLLVAGLFILMLTVVKYLFEAKFIYFKLPISIIYVILIVLIQVHYLKKGLTKINNNYHYTKSKIKFDCIGTGYAKLLIVEVLLQYIPVFGIVLRFLYIQF